MADILEEWKKLRPMLGDMICHMDSKMAQIEAEEKRIQEKRDESYIRGLNDAYEAIGCIVKYSPDGGMPYDDLTAYFGYSGIYAILDNFSMQQIIDRVDQWKADKEKEAEQKKTQQVFHIGDQVTAEEGSSKFFITSIIPETGCVSGIDFEGRAYSYFLEDLTKTGAHNTRIRELMKSMEAIK